MNSWTLLGAAVGVALVLEGLPYFISPAAMRRYLAMVGRMSDLTLRATGLAMIVAGLLVAYAATR